MQGSASGTRATQHGLRNRQDSFDPLSTPNGRSHDISCPYTSESNEYKYGEIVDPSTSQHPFNPLPTSNDESIENVQGTSCQPKLSQTSAVKENAPTPTNNQPGATRTGRRSKPPSRYSPTPPATNSSTDNTRAAARGVSTKPGHRTAIDCTPPNNGEKRDQKHREGFSGHVQKKRKTAAATQELYAVNFADVFQDGSAHHKHMIVQYPPESDRWYILRCDVHGLHFNQNPLHGAARHMRATEHHGPKRHLDINTLKAADSWSLAIQTIGLRVLDCDTTKAQQNNAVFTQALDAGYKPLRPDSSKQLAPSKETCQILSRSQPALRKQEVVGDASGLATRAESEENDGEFITHPLEGKPYLGYWHSGSRGQGWYALVVLPLGSFDEIGLHGSFLETELTKSIPACYDRRNPTVLQWAEGYRAGERLVTNRRFPVMWFLDDQSFPLRKDMMAPTPAWYNWLPASDLRPFSAVCGTDGNKRPSGYKSALEYAKQLERIKMARHQYTIELGETLIETTGLCVPPDRNCADADAEFG